MCRPAWGVARLGRACLRSIPPIATFLICVACSKAAKPGSGVMPANGETPAAAPIRVAQDEVVLEGRWAPENDQVDARAVGDTVRVVCNRSKGACDEELIHSSSQHGHRPAPEKLTYRVQKWTKWGIPAGSLLASRSEGGVEVVIRVSLSGLAAEKAYVGKGAETRWRLE